MNNSKRLSQHMTCGPQSNSFLIATGPFDLGTETRVISLQTADKGAVLYIQMTSTEEITCGLFLSQELLMKDKPWLAHPQLFFRCYHWWNAVLQPSLHDTKMS